MTNSLFKEEVLTNKDLFLSFILHPFQKFSELSLGSPYFLKSGHCYNVGASNKRERARERDRI